MPEISGHVRLSTRCYFLANARRSSPATLLLRRTITARHAMAASFRDILHPRKGLNKALNADTSLSTRQNNRPTRGHSRTESRLTDSHSSCSTCAVTLETFGHPTCRGSQQYRLQFDSRIFFSMESELHPAGSEGATGRDGPPQTGRD